MVETDELAICATCATQYDEALFSAPLNCKICDDPRQYVPPTGQAWTSLGEMKTQDLNNDFKQDDVDDRIWYIHTQPKTGINQRAILIQTDHGNILWDLIAYLDDETISKIRSMGGLKAIVISHPHYYTTHIHWAKTFDCPVYLADADKEWLCCTDSESSPRRRFITESTQEIAPGVTAIVAGGHFPGSLLLLWEKHLFIADTIMTAPSGLYHVNRPPGTISFNFFWSYPNMIPLPPDEVENIWKAIEPFDFESTHGAFPNQEIRAADVKARMLESMKIQTRFEGWAKHAILDAQV